MPPAPPCLTRYDMVSCGPCWAHSVRSCDALGSPCEDPRASSQGTLPTCAQGPCFSHSGDPGSGRWALSAPGPGRQRAFVECLSGCWCRLRLQIK